MTKISMISRWVWAISSASGFLFVCLFNLLLLFCVSSFHMHSGNWFGGETWRRGSAMDTDDGDINQRAAAKWQQMFWVCCLLHHPNNMISNPDQGFHSDTSQYPARRGVQNINLIFPSMKSTLTPPKKTSVQGDLISCTEKSTSSQGLEVWMEQLSPDAAMVLNLGTHETHLATVATVGKSPGTQHSDPDTCDIFGPCKDFWNSDAQTLKIKHSK